MMSDHQSTIESYPGLSAAEVAERIARGESNDFEARVGRTYWQIARDNVFNLFNIVLFVLVLIVLGFQEYATALFASFSVVVNAFTGMVQEIRARRKLDQLAALAATDVPVYRDAALTAVPLAGLVKDDVIPIARGDKVVVDGRLLHADALEMDESHLTGESDAVLKATGDEVYSGSFCIAGAGVMVATGVGAQSTINRLSVIAKTYKNGLTPTQEKIEAIVQLSVIGMLIIAPMIFISGYINRLDFLEVVKNAVVFTTSLVPQGLVLASIISLTFGAINISRRQTLVQRVNAVESLANASVLCFDKTGTLTENRLAVVEILPLNNAPAALVGKLHSYTENLAHLNQTAAAVAAYVLGNRPNGNSAVPAKLAEIPFNSTRQWGAVTLPDETLILGAPERILCMPQGAELAQRAQTLAAEGMRVLAFAKSSVAPDRDELDAACEPLGLVVMSDRVRSDIHDTLDAFREQNIALKVISGDNIETVKAIARQAGLPSEHCYHGDALENMSELELEEAALEGQLFARVEPETKRKLVQALQNRAHYVAMVGDGVNDVPALKQADLAIAMNDGAQMSKDIAEIVLLNNAMSTLPLAFEKGRAITQVMYGTTKLFLAKNIYSLLLILFAGFMAMPFPVDPIQISWVTFGTVNVPATLLAFQWIRPETMKSFRRDVLEYSLTAGIVGAVSMTITYATVYLATDNDVNSARSAAMIYIALFNTLIVWSIFGIKLRDAATIINHYRTFVLAAALAALMLIAPFALPDLFQFARPTLLVTLLIAANLLLSAAGLSVTLRSRRLISAVWELFDA